jgi:hypothetical protein
MSPMLLLILAYFVLLAGISAGAMPYRRRLRELGAELCALDLNERERRLVEGMLLHAYSWRMAPMALLVYLAGLLQSGYTLDERADQGLESMPSLMGDPRFHCFSEAFFASIVGVNPLFGIFAILARWAFKIKARIHRNSKGAQRITDLWATSTV